MKTADQDEVQNYILNTRQSIVNKLVSRFGNEMYDYQHKLLKRYIDCKDKQLSQCYKYQNHPAIKLQIAERVFNQCLNLNNKRTDVYSVIDECSRQFQNNVEVVFQKQFIKCEQILRQY